MGERICPVGSLPTAPTWPSVLLHELRIELPARL
jgi:hypothetical protein